MVVVKMDYPPGTRVPNVYAHPSALEERAVNMSIGRLVFSRLSPVVDVFVPVGAECSTNSRKRSVVVMADPQHPDFDRWSHGYRLRTGHYAITVPVYAVDFGNIRAGEVGLIVTPISGIDSVINPEPIFEEQPSAS